MTVDPAEDCLVLQIGTPSSAAICGEPQLTGFNHCAEVLTLPPVPEGASADHAVTVAPGAEVVYGVVGYTSDQGARYELPATLGSTLLTLSFTTSKL